MNKRTFDTKFETFIRAVCVVPFGTFPIAASITFFLSLLGDRGPGERELGRSLLLFPFLFLLMSCLKLNDSAVDHFPFANHGLQNPLVSRLRFLLLSSAFRLMGAALAVLFRFLIQVTFDHICQACAACWFILLYCILVVQNKCGLHLFRISESCLVHTFKCVILGSVPHG